MKLNHLYTLVHLWIWVGLAGILIPWWWGFAPCCAAVTFFRCRRGWEAWGLSFLAVFLLWGALALGMDWVNESRLSHRVSLLMGIPHPIILIMASGLVGGLVAGLAGLSGWYLRVCLRVHQTI